MPKGFPMLVRDVNDIGNFVNNAGLMNAVAASEAAMNAVAASETAMNAVAASETARTAIWNSSIAWNIVASSNMAVGKYVAGAAGLNPADFADMNAIVSSETAMNVVVASETAMNVVASSATARNAIWNSSTAWSIVASSNMAVGKYVAGAAGLNPADFADMNAIVSSETAMNAVAASETAMNAVAASETAMNAVASSTIAMNAVASSDIALAAIASSALAADIVKSAIQDYRDTIIATLDSSSLFTKQADQELRTSGAGCNLQSALLNTNTIIIPKTSPDQYPGYETSATSRRYLYYGTDSSFVIWASSEVGLDYVLTITTGVSMRGIYYKQDNCGSSYDSAVICDVYTVVS